MKIVDKYAPKITRDGDVFTYMGPIDEKAKTIDLPSIFRAAAATQAMQLNTVAALAFLEDCLTSFVTTAEGCNEYQAVGLAAIFRALTDSANEACTGQHREHQIIKALAAGDL